MNSDSAQIAGADPEPERAGGASRVAAGIAFSRLLGFLREMALAFFLGAGPHVDVFRTALRGPNLLQNLLGEQTLSASFIPVYSRFLGAGRREAAGRFAGAVFGLLVATAGAISLLGVLFAEPLVGLIAPGYLLDAAAVEAGEAAVDRFPLAVRAVRLIFPMTGILVLSAWALGVLNSHRRFFISYFAPTLWNAAIIAALYVAARARSGAPHDFVPGLLDSSGRSDLVIAACVGALVGGALQFAIQLPWVARSLKGFRLSFSVRVDGVRDALRAFVPLLAGRGAVQISGYVDYLLASFLAAGAVAALGWAQTLYLLPISLFGMSVAAAELPELARRRDVASRAAILTRVRAGFLQMTFLTVPSAVGFLAFGFPIVAVLFRRGAFGLEDNWLVYLVLAAYSVGLVASTTSRLLNNVFYAKGDTAKPARIAVERVTLSAGLGIVLMIWLDRYAVGQLINLESAGRLRLGAVGLALSAGVSSWYELWRLTRSLESHIGRVALPARRLAAVGLVAVVATLPGFAAWYLLRHLAIHWSAPVVVGIYGATYLAGAHMMGLGSLGQWLRGSRSHQRRKGGGE
jgi:putative peptidoglycan lipid II flippase